MYAGNFKAMYQRARAHAALCNEEEAQRDFDMVEKLDPNLKPIIRQELKKLSEAMRTKHTCQKKTYWDTTQEKWGPGKQGEGCGEEEETFTESRRGKTRSGEEDGTQGELRVPCQSSAGERG